MLIFINLLLGMVKKNKINFVVSTLKLTLNTGLDKAIFEVLQHLKKSYEIKLSGGTTDNKIKSNGKLNNIDLSYVVKVKSTKFLYLQILTWFETILYILFKISINKSYLSIILNISKQNDSIIFLQDIIFAPYLLIGELKNKIYFGITDAQSLRFFNLLKIENNFIKKIYFFICFIYVICIEKYIFKNAIKIHTFGYKDFKYLSKKHDNIFFVPIRKDYLIKNYKYKKKNNFSITFYGNFKLAEQQKYYHLLTNSKIFNRISLLADIRIIGMPPNDLTNFNKFNIKYDYLKENDLKTYLTESDIIILFDEVRSGMSNRALEATKSGSYIIGTKASFNGLSINNNCFISNNIELWIKKIIEISNIVSDPTITKSSTNFNYEGDPYTWKKFFDN